MGRHGAPDARLLADHHALQDTRVAEAEGGRDGGVAGCEGGAAEGGREAVQVVADFIDGVSGRAEEGRGGWRVGGGRRGRWRGKGIFFEEETDLVVRGEEVVVADVRV